MSSVSERSAFAFTRELAVFIDIERFTTVPPRLDDEMQVVEFLDGYYTLCHEEVSKRGGEVVKYMGDAVVAVRRLVAVGGERAVGGRPREVVDEQRDRVEHE